jgi:broad specificity phosphatase PhoE
MHVRTAVLIAAALLAIAGCASSSPPVSAMAPEGITYIVVRHAEKATDDPRDPALSAAGQARAEALAKRFSTTRLSAAYATAFKRTQQTALPAATASGIAITTYDASQPAADFVAQLRRVHARGSVLVVGHSNTVPGIVAALCACAVAALDESRYGDVYEVSIDDAGTATLNQGNY